MNLIIAAQVNLWQKSAASVTYHNMLHTKRPQEERPTLKRNADHKGKNNHKKSCQSVSFAPKIDDNFLKHWVKRWGRLSVKVSSSGSISFFIVTDFLRKRINWVNIPRRVPERKNKMKQVPMIRRQLVWEFYLFVLFCFVWNVNQKVFHIRNKYLFWLRMCSVEVKRFQFMESSR